MHECLIWLTEETTEALYWLQNYKKYHLFHHNIIFKESHYSTSITHMSCHYIVFVFIQLY